MAVTTKCCSKCHAERPATLEFFGPDKRASNGLQSACRECTRAYDRMRYTSPHRQAKTAEYRAAHREERAAKQRDYVARNPERVAERKKKYYAQHREAILARGREYRAQHCEERRAKQRQWYEDNADKRRAAGKDYYRRNAEAGKRRAAQWYQENRDRALEACRLWRARNQDRVRCHSRARKARNRNAVGVHTPADVTAQIERQRGRCYWCKQKVGNVYHVDHVIPLAGGGTNGPENIVVACPTCNLSKGAKHPMEWAGRLC